MTGGFKFDAFWLYLVSGKSELTWKGWTWISLGSRVCARDHGIPLTDQGWTQFNLSPQLSPLRTGTVALADLQTTSWLLAMAEHGHDQVVRSLSCSRNMWRRQTVSYFLSFLLWTSRFIDITLMSQKWACVRLRPVSYHITGAITFVKSSPYTMHNGVLCDWPCGGRKGVEDTWSLCVDLFLCWKDG